MIDMQAVMSHPALNLRSIMLLSFRPLMQESSMLTTYLKTPLTLERYRSGPAGPHLGVAGAMGAKFTVRRK